MAWLNCANGHDLGKNPYFSGPRPQHPDWGVAWSEDHVRAYFSDIAAKKFKVVRIWAFEKLEGLQFENAHFDSRQIVRQSTRDGQTVFTEYTGNYVRWNIPQVKRNDGLCPEFQSNVRRLMEIAQDNDLEIYWTILSGANYFKNPSTHHAWALKKMLENSSCRSSFIEYALQPFLQILQPFSNNVYAIDFINEPEGLYGGMLNATLGGLLNTLTDEAKNYIQEASRIIRRAFPQFKLSVGFRDVATIVRNTNNSDGNGLENHLDFFDFHLYGDGARIPLPILIDGKKFILGEFGYRSGFSFMPNDSQQEQAFEQYSFLALSRRDIYQGCFVWMYTPVPTSEDTNNLLMQNDKNPCGDDSTRAEFLRSFTNNPDSHWRPVRDVIIRRGQEIERLNGGTP